MPLNRSQLKAPELAAEPVNVPELGGEVVVQAMMMSDRLQIATAALPQFAHVAEVLARSVVDDEGERVWTAAQWEIFGGQHQDAAWRLFEIAQRLSKLGGADEKNDQAPS
jgi:hypothetical protein